MTLDIDKLNFEKCEDEPIHIPESIQGYGYLFALDGDYGQIKIVSKNVENLLKDHNNIIGSHFFDLLEDKEELAFLKETYKRAKNQNTRLPLRIGFKEECIKDGCEKTFNTVVYDSGDLFVIELEPAAQFRETYSAAHFSKLYATRIAPRFKTYKSLGMMAQEIVDTIKYITNMERVVLYKFNEDASGHVIAEAKEDDIESYLGLYYPASDIPAQARELYKKNWVRLTPNVNLDPSPLIPSAEESGRQPLDLTFSILRSLSPIHRQYIRNQGLKASLSMSLVTHDKLWGMISCHSRKVRYVPQDVRLECENISQLFSWHLYAKEEELYIQRKEQTDIAIKELLDKTDTQNHIVDVFKENEQEVLNIMDADGFIFHTEMETIVIGTCPDLNLVRDLFINTRKKDNHPFDATNIIKMVDDKDSLNDIRGVLFMPLVEHRNYFTGWFRKEHRQVQRWAGSPDEKRATGSKRERLMPRSSFKVHEKVIKDKSKEWDHRDIVVAERFNKVFMSYALETQGRMLKDIYDLELENKYKNEFLATLAHELRNPLTPITAGIALLEGDEYDDRQKKIIGMIKRQADHMTTMINDLMDVSRITQDKVQLEKKQLEIQRVVTDAVETCEQIIKEKGHQVQLNLPDEAIYTMGDPTRLSQIFVNIINNAAKYTDHNGEISVTVKQKNNEVLVSIKDNGLGIPADKINSIFDMFTQMDAHSSNAKGGLGIGLTLVKKLVSLHKGEILARSNGIGKGSEFVVLLPIAHHVSHKQNESNNIDTINERTKALIVDDNEDVTATLQILLESSGFKIEVASSGEQAIKLFPEYQPDLAILDIGLPDMSGFDLCKQLSSSDKAVNTIFFAHSGWGNKEQLLKAEQAGFHEYLIKPLDIQKFKSLLLKYAGQ
ncbi:ATP-binding protein [Fulvivirga ulvae]|uniref:ATP-binding protein n=1 Tax=Fulvivirga ulvae TaxID=2904245 RepID=UPI001F2A0F3F|nr:ATP-binding protein [Fulvivirga ulvae]UII35002.1 ATP-binding protein [Fulvivirga ulvae]